MAAAKVTAAASFTGATSFSAPAAAPKLSILHGPVDPPLVDLTLGELLEIQASQHCGEECLIIPWTGARWSYHDLHQQSSLLSQVLLLDLGVGAGDRVGIMAGNCEQYAAVFFAVAKIGAILVILNNSYTPAEAFHGLSFSSCKVFFTTRVIGTLDNAPLLLALGAAERPRIQVVILRGESMAGYPAYDELLRSHTGRRRDRDQLFRIMRNVLPHQVVNLQFTSGTTGLPKAAMLTHHNLINNARFVGDRLRLTPEDVLCCPPPLFHCFGLVLGLLAVITHGAKIVYPAEVFDTAATLRAISDEECTAVHGVPAMFDSLLQAELLPAWCRERLRTGIIAGAPVPRYLIAQLVERLGMSEFTSSYGLTEASPTCFNAFTDDTMEKRLTTVGTLIPHAHAKIIGSDGQIVAVGTRGELCIAGYQLQVGYWNNAEKTCETMVRDAAGMLWLHTGDEAAFDERGYCIITGRFKDIIRGGENIYPLEIEERLMAHPSICRAIAVGLEDTHYGEVVGVFVQDTGGDSGRPSDSEVCEWVQSQLGKQKAPAHVFWLGEGGVPTKVPLTGSGKVRKFDMARLGNEMLAKQRKQAKL